MKAPELVRIPMRLPRPLLTRLRRAAQAEDRSVNKFMQIVLRAALARRGRA